MQKNSAKQSRVIFLVIFFFYFKMTAQKSLYIKAFVSADIYRGKKRPSNSGPH